MKFNTKYNYGKVPGFTFQKPSMVQPQFGYECDINNIVAGCVNTIDMVRPVQFADTTTFTDLQTALDTVLNANTEFAALPSNIRERFGNDPRQLLKFLENTDNREEAIKLGLISKTSFTNDVQATETPVVTPTTLSESAS